MRHAMRRAVVLRRRVLLWARVEVAGAAQLAQADGQHADAGERDLADTLGAEDEAVGPHLGVQQQDLEP
eukprot:4623523-Alexandrium_andersonii.AAC.1